MPSNTRADVQRFSEELALVMEQDGLPRTAGRILGWLLICDPPQQTAAGLAEAIGASRASISTMTRLLIQAGLIERRTRPGDRRNYYQFRLVAWPDLIRERLRTLRALRDLADRGAALLPRRDADRRRWLAELRSLYGWLEQELPDVLARWERHHRRGTARTPRRR